MNKPQFTPGPWRFVADGPMDDNCDMPRVDVPAEFSGSGYCNNPSIESADGKEIVGCGEYLVFGPKFQKEERAANVRLLCSAPDLYAALENQVNCWDAMLEHAERLDDSGMAYSCRNAIHHARAAIARATGGAA